ncbi:MAG: hypothetical protein J6Q79_01830 [Clostridia bacterium]|nr:hypothetical protein [Clostridia bacterium]
MKKFMVIAMVLLSLLLLASCGGGGEDPTTTVPSTTETTTEPVTESESAKALAEFQKHMKDEGYLCGVAYLGYYSEDIGVIIEDLKYKGIYDKHKFLDEIKRKNFYSLEGSEFYAVVPAEGVNITVNEYGFNEEGIGYAIKEIVKITDGTPVFIRGNISDIMPNIQLIITDENGAEKEYLPSMSLENGLLSKGQQIYDFSPYDLIGGHFEDNGENNEGQLGFIGSWWGEYTLNDELLSLTMELTSDGMATYGYGYGNSEILEYFEGSWYYESEDSINLIMYGGPQSSDGSEADSTEQYETDIMLSWSYDENNSTLTLTHLSGGVLLSGTEGESFTFEKME